VPKFTVLGRFEADRVPAIVPPDYKSVVRAVTAPGTVYTVVLFAHDRRDVVTSAPVRRALAEIAAGDQILAVGTNFTAEATALLNLRDAAIARLGEFYWTDESYNSLH
jgi:hypothetical protein